MAPNSGRRSLLLGVAATLLLAGCGSWWQQQQRAHEQRLSRQRCQQQRVALEQRLAPVEADQRTLATITAERYVPTPKPQPPDPALASRYSLLDQQLDAERYEAQLKAWQMREEQRQQRWQQNQAERSGRVKQQLRQHLNELAALERQLVNGETLDAARVERARRCT